MAQGYLEHFAKERANIYSAGIETHGLNQKAVAIMKYDGQSIK
jgi:arsenate reductase